MQSKIAVTPDNPYSEVHIPRAKLRSQDDGVATVIANPMAVASGNGNPYGDSGSAPPPYMVKEDVGGEEGGGRCGACCYRCRRKK